jgi:hypothetical protein
MFVSFLPAMDAHKSADLEAEDWLLGRDAAAVGK